MEVFTLGTAFWPLEYPLHLLELSFRLVVVLTCKVEPSWKVRYGMRQMTVAGVNEDIPRLGMHIVKQTVIAR